MPVIPIERIADGSLVLAKARRAFALPPGWTLQDVPQGVLSGTPGGPGEVTGYLQLVPPSSSFGGQGLDLVTFLSFVTGSGGGPVGACVVQPSADFPGTTKARLYAEVWADGTGGASNWTATTSYSSTTTPPSIVNVPTGQGSTNALFVATTSGTSSGTTGPTWSGTGPSTGLQDQGGSACRWRAALANMVLKVNGTQVAALAQPYTLAGALAAPGGYGNLRLTYDLTSALMGLTSPAFVVLGLEGDAADTAGVTKALISRARLIFS